MEGLGIGLDLYSDLDQEGDEVKNFLFSHDYIKEYSRLSIWSEFVKDDFCCNFSSFLNRVYRFPIKTANLAIRMLFRRMTENIRFYHTPIHILSGLFFAQKNYIKLANWEILAFIYHDAEYEVGSDENEKNSCDFARQYLSGYISDIDKVTDGIMATGKYLDLDVDEKYSRIMDLDFSHFAWPREVFLMANKNIELEFVRVIGKDAFESGRIEFLRGLLKRPIFRSPSFAVFEKMARENLELVLEKFDIKEKIEA
jgi:predicted metal-dependent HD superfamily phosphohydrolase